MGGRTRGNQEEKSESVWSSSNLFLARHMFIFNAAVSDKNEISQSEDNEKTGRKGPIVGLCTMIKT